MKKFKIAFVCVHNSCRSQMAEALLNMMKNEKFEVYSAGTEEYHEVKPLAVKAMEELGCNMENYYPKLLKDIPNQLDILITMGCNVQCPHVPSKYREDFGITDPSGGVLDDYIKARNLIQNKIEILITRIDKGEINL